jgi:large subunit ribosomal protein L22
MTIKTTQKNTRQTPRKVRLVANAVKNVPLNEAFRQLGVIERRATMVLMKVLRQAVANAVHNFGYSPEDLSLKSILVTDGPRYKRFRAVSRGRAHNIIKRTSHITVELEAKGVGTGVQAQAPETKQKAEVKPKATAKTKSVATKPKAAAKKTSVSKPKATAKKTPATKTKEKTKESSK